MPTPFLATGAIDTAKLFLDFQKPIVTVVSGTGPLSYATDYAPADEVSTKDISPANPDLKRPLLVLVDKQTASAAEENDRAKIIGASTEYTFGKGIIQTVQRLQTGAGVAVTVARYETPLGNSINKKGTQPCVTAMLGTLHRSLNNASSAGVHVNEQVACEIVDSGDKCLSRVASLP
eukprot:scaffold1108_cov260-Pinguiococcus_pyrenoidosus.AAC.3